MTDWTLFRDAHVLITDDSRAIRLYLRSILTDQGSRVEEAGDAASALERLAARRFDLVLLDLVLPDMDGLEVLDRIRAEDQETAVVVITGAGGLRSATEALHRGADGYIEKQHLAGPAMEDPEAFLRALQQALEHRSGLVAHAQLQQLKTDFYSMVTHDLRNPAGSVWGILRMLLAGKAGPLNDKQEKLLTLAQSSASKLIGLINDYLDFAKIDAGHLRIETQPTDLRKVVRCAAEAAEVQASLRQQELTLQLPPEPLMASVDAGRIDQVLDNLLSNAIKYTPEGGRIRMMLHCVDDARVEIRVADSGMGIAPDQLDSLFTPFHRVSGESMRGIRGTGLGLVVVKEIVEAHEGSVWAESEGVPGRGSTFVVRLPVAPRPATTAAASGDPA